MKVAPFAVAPRPTDEELLGSWISRVAVANGCGVAEFLRGGHAPSYAYRDLDWRAEPELLTWLSAGSGVKVERLRQMTLSVRYPASRRADFAWSVGPVFAGRHAFCPACARAGDARHRAPISRLDDAGLWRVTCLRHGVYLDSVRGPGDIYSERSAGRHSRLRHTLARGEPTPAPNFATAFDRAALRACGRRRPGGLWKVKDPANFLRTSALLASLMLVERRPGAGVESAMAALLGARPFAMPGMSAAVYEPNLIRRAPTFLRVRAFAAAALLLLKQRAAIRLGLPAWVIANLPFDRPENFLLDPWRVAAEAWSRPTLWRAFRLGRHLPSQLCWEVRRESARRLRLVGIDPFRKRT